MYKVFVNDIPIILSTTKDMGEKYLSIPLEVTKIKKILGLVGKGKLKNVNLFHENEKELLNIFSQKIRVVQAGGGLVKNKKGEVLFIFRNGKWDLPKGKREPKESLEECAVREVEEETGIQGLEIVDFLDTTYHIFKRGGKMKLKETHWYEMKSNYQGPFKPELEEDITKVRWKSEKKMRKALTKSYANIQLLFPENLLPVESDDGVSHM